MTNYAQQNRAPELDALARRLTASGDFKVLRRLVPRRPSPALADQAEKIGIIIDLETTGLDHTRDEVIELGIVKFRYSERGAWVEQMSKPAGTERSP
jgi:DNA polymerase III subunit epsilon